jgi:hypothetical protein
MTVSAIVDGIEPAHIIDPDHRAIGQSGISEDSADRAHRCQSQDDQQR